MILGKVTQLLRNYLSCVLPWVHIHKYLFVFCFLFDTNWIVYAEMFIDVIITWWLTDAIQCALGYLINFNEIWGACGFWMQLWHTTFYNRTLHTSFLVYTNGSGRYNTNKYLYDNYLTIINFASQINICVNFQNKTYNIQGFCDITSAKVPTLCILYFSVSDSEFVRYMAQKLQQELIEWLTVVS